MAEIQNPVEPLVKADGVNFTREQIERLLAAACNLLGQGMAAREKCREDFRDAEREEDNTLRIMVDGLVASLQDKLSQPIEKVDPGISYQIGLVTSGDLLRPNSLHRHRSDPERRPGRGRDADPEATRIRRPLNELDKRPLDKLEGKTPNIGMFFMHGGGEMYGHLSEMAHFSKPCVSELMHVIQNGDRIGPSLYLPWLLPVNPLMTRGRRPPRDYAIERSTFYLALISLMRVWTSRREIASSF